MTEVQNKVQALALQSMQETVKNQHASENDESTASAESTSNSSVCCEQWLLTQMATTHRLVL